MVIYTCCNFMNIRQIEQNCKLEILKIRGWILDVLGPPPPTGLCCLYSSSLTEIYLIHVHIFHESNTLPVILMRRIY